MKTILKNCLHCEKEFNAPVKEVNRGNGKYCCLDCSRRSQKGRIVEKEPNCECATCKILLYRNSSRLKNSKHNVYFCSRACKDKALRKKDGYYIHDISPYTYDSNIPNISRYREKALANKELICEDCGYNTHPEVLIVHHIDRDRKNSNLTNLKILCPTCHDLDHFFQNDGRFSYLKK